MWVDTDRWDRGGIFGSRRGWRWHLELFSGNGVVGSDLQWLSYANIDRAHVPHLGMFSLG